MKYCITIKCFLSFNKTWENAQDIKEVKDRNTVGIVC